MVKIVKGYSRLPGQIDQRNAEKGYRHDKQEGNAIFMRHMQHGSFAAVNAAGLRGTLA